MFSVAIRWCRFLFRINPLALLLAVMATEGHTTGVDVDFNQAVRDAAFPEEREISKYLFPINRDNPELVWNTDGSKILVATWKAQGAYERFIKPYDKTSENPEYVVWVTIVPQVKHLCSELRVTEPEISKEAVNLRLKQYLGLNPDWKYDTFVEMWVDPRDLFRPCVDPQIDDKSCNLHFGETTSKVNNIVDYKEFYRDLYYKSFRGSAGVPWTGLGYTYDWGNPDSEVGASEYILVPEAPYEIKAVVPTMEYCSS